MKKQLSENWQLWILMASIFLVLSAGARKIALDLGWSEFNANIVFIASFLAVSVIYLVFHDLSVKLLQPLFDKLFNRLGFKPKKKDNHPEEKIVIDYGTTRNEKIRKQEARIIALESMVVKYIGDTMSPYMTEGALSRLIEISCEFFHMKLPPEFLDSDAVTVSDELSTQDLMHFGWNIARPFRKPCLHTALFLKQIFPGPFRNTEVYTIEKKLRVNPMQGRIKIDKDIAGQRDEKAATARNEKASPTSKAAMNKSKTKNNSAQQAAIVDMLEDGFTGSCDFEDMLIEE